MYAGTHFLPFFRRLDRIDEVTAGKYATRRLRQVKGRTVNKELSALRGFMKWSKQQGYIDRVPSIESVSPHAGVACSTQSRKSRPIVLTSDEAEAVIAHLPDRTRGGCRPRAFYTVMWDTGFRRATLWRLRAPEHFRRGDTELTITPEIDKARYGRTLPLLDRTVEALDAVCPDVGLIFGQHDLRHSLRSAARAAGLPKHKWERLSNHDFRHSAITLWASESPNLAGVQFLAGHKHATTTSIYINSNQEHAREVLNAVAARRRQRRAGL